MAQISRPRETVTLKMDQKRYCCSICLEILRDPGTLPCGHSYCFDCITEYWNNEEVSSCPQCRRTFTPSPTVVKNTVLADLIMDVQKTEDRPCATAVDVACDVCVGRKKKAVKSCLGCLASFCQEHLQSHYEIAGLRRHKLEEPMSNFEENICTRHDEVMKIFCCHDRQVICYLCSIDEHRGHRTVSAEAERNERQKKLGVKQEALEERIEKVEQDVGVLQQEIDSINRSADEAETYNESISAEMIQSIQGWKSKVNAMIRTTEQAEVCRVVELQKTLQQEITDMRLRVADLQSLCQTQSHVHFLKRYPWNFKLEEHTAVRTRDVHPPQYLQQVTVALAKMIQAVEIFLNDQIPHISQAVAQVDVLLAEPPDFKTKREFLLFSDDITIDHVYNSEYLILSNDRRTVTARACKRERDKLRRSKKGAVQPDWATGKCLSEESLTDRHYWELKCEAIDISIAVGYKNYSWSQRGFGNDDKSWTLNIKEGSMEFKHKEISTRIPGPCPSRVGVYLDFRAGHLCFYNVSKIVTLLRKVQTTFTQPVYAAIWLNVETGGSVQFCYPLQVQGNL